MLIISELNKNGLKYGLKPALVRIFLTTSHKKAALFSRTKPPHFKQSRKEN